MNLSIKTRFNYNQIVKCRFKNFRPGELVDGVIIGMNFWQTRGMRPDAGMVNYIVSPLEYEGFEHDDEEQIPECHTDTKAIPRIETRVTN